MILVWAFGILLSVQEVHACSPGLSLVKVLVDTLYAREGVEP